MSLEKDNKDVEVLAGCLWKLFKYLFFGFITFIGLGLFLGYRNGFIHEEITPARQKYSYEIVSMDSNEFKKAYYPRVVLYMPKNQPPTLNEANEIFEELLKPGINKLSMFIYLPTGYKTDTVFARCLKTKYENTGCEIMNEFIENGAERVKSISQKYLNKSIDWCQLVSDLSDDHLKAIHQADKIYPSYKDHRKLSKKIDQLYNIYFHKALLKYTITKAQHDLLYVEIGASGCNF